MEIIDCELQKFTIRLNEKNILFVIIYGIWKGFCVLRFSWKRVRNLGMVGYILNNFIVVVIITRYILFEKI